MESEKKQDLATEDELAAYEKLRRRVSKSFGEIQEKISPKAISSAIDRATGELKEMGGHSVETVNKAAAALKKDIASTTEHFKPKVDGATENVKKEFENLSIKGGALWNDISRESERMYEYSRDKGGSFLLNIARGLSEWSHQLSEKLDASLKYKTGEITHGGEFVCTSCDARIHLKQPGRIPPCPKCTKTDFRRS
jgi:Zinc-ribbon containing domain